jgi:hypothetical protein
MWCTPLPRNNCRTNTLSALRTGHLHGSRCSEPAVLHGIIVPISKCSFSEWASDYENFFPIQVMLAPARRPRRQPAVPAALPCFHTAVAARMYLNICKFCCFPQPGIAPGLRGTFVEHAMPPAWCLLFALSTPPCTRMKPRCRPHAGPEWIETIIAAKPGRPAGDACLNASPLRPYRIQPRSQALYATSRRSSGPAG